MIEERPSADSSVCGDGDIVHVVATSLEGTREALEAATALARGLSGRVVVFIRRAAPRLHSDHSFDEADAALRRLIDSYTPRPKVMSCVCARAIDVVQLFQSPGFVVIGGEAAWWPTAEQRLAQALTRVGCKVTFVHISHGAFVSPLVRTAREAPVAPVRTRV